MNNEEEGRQILKKAKELTKRIHTMRKAGYTITEISHTTGVSPGTVKYVIEKKDRNETSR